MGFESLKIRIMLSNDLKKKTPMDKNTKVNV